MTDITASTTNDEIYQMVIDYVMATRCDGGEGDKYMEYLFAARKAARRFNAEYEAALNVGRQYEATGDMGVFFHTTEREAAL